MNSSSQSPLDHQKLERQFAEHIERLLRDDRLRLQTTRGRKPITAFLTNIKKSDKAVDLKRLMVELNKPDRTLESQMPIGQSMDVAILRKSFWILKSLVGNLRMVCVSPARALVTGNDSSPMSAADVAKLISDLPPAHAPTTLVVMSTSGFAPETLTAIAKITDRAVILAAPDLGGGWTIQTSAPAKDLADIFNPEAEAAKRQRIRAEIELARVDLLSGGVAADRLAKATHLPEQLVEEELKSYARANAGLAARKLDGRMVLFRDGAGLSSPAGAAGGFNMPFMDSLKTLFARKGEIEKKISLLSERRAALSQQRDRSYEDISALEGKESQLRKEFADAPGEIPRRRITSQLVQVRKDIDRRQQLLSMLNQQINIVGTHLLNLELQQQGKSAKLPSADDIAADAAAAEEVMAELTASGELADSVASSAPSGLSSEEQAVYDELMGGKTSTESAKSAARSESASTPSIPASKSSLPEQSPKVDQRKPAEPEAG